MDARMRELEQRVAELEAEKRVKKHSQNSSIPPSKDFGSPQRNQSLRKSSGRKPGGQPGHQGHTLEMSATPDTIINHMPAFCQRCGIDLNNVAATLIGKRQVVDIPVVRPTNTEHRIYSKRCTCGMEHSGAYPRGVDHNMQYGSRIESMISYLSVRQYVPYHRMGEMFQEMFGLSISEGSIDNMLERFSKKAFGMIDHIKTSLAAATVVGSDETGIKIGGKTNALWTWQNEENTLLIPAGGRGYQTVEEHIGQMFANTVLVHDCWAAQLKTPAKTHQLCLAHLMRDINYLIELTNSGWVLQIKELFGDAIKLKNELLPKDYLDPMPARTTLEKRLDRLLNQVPESGYKEVTTFYKRLNKHRNYLFVFLYQDKVPFHNNDSEKAIRNAKVKQKVSGQFKTFKGAIRFAVIRSVIDTCIKRGKNVFNALELVTQVAPE